MSHLPNGCGGLINRQVQGSPSEPAALITFGWLLTRRLGTQSAGFWSVMGWNLRCTARCLVPISLRNIQPSSCYVEPYRGCPRYHYCQQDFGLSSLRSPPIWFSYMGRVTSGFKKGEACRARFALQSSADNSAPKRRARPQRLPSRPAYKPAEQERLYFHLNADRAVRRHAVPDRALPTKGLIKCKHYHRLRDQQGEGRHDVTIHTRSRERRKRDHSWDGQAYFLLPTSRGNKRLGRLP